MNFWGSFVSVEHKIHEFFSLEAESLHAHEGIAGLNARYVTGIVPFVLSTIYGRKVTSISCWTRSGLALRNVLNVSLLDLTSETMSGMLNSSRAVRVSRPKISLRSILGLEPEENSLLSFDTILRSVHSLWLVTSLFKNICFFTGTLTRWRNVIVFSWMPWLTCYNFSNFHSTVTNINQIAFS